MKAWSDSWQSARDKSSYRKPIEYMAIWKEHQRESWTKLESLEDLRDFWEVEKIEKIKE